MPGRRRWTVRDLRRDNRSVLLWSLYFDQPCSRQDLSEATGLSSASVSNVTRELFHEGIVVEAGSVDSDGGRPRVLLRINPDYGYVVGIDVGETRIRVKLFDLTMAVRANADIPLEPREHGVDVVVDRILRCLSAVLADSGVPPEAILGVGVGVPGMVEHGAEVVLYGQTYGWDAVPLERLLRAGTDLPLYIDNGANAMGLAEQWFGAGQGARHAVVCLIGSGIGASIIGYGAAEPAVRLQRDRMGPYDDHGRRAGLPLRLARAPRGLRRRRGDPRTLRPAAAGRRRGVGAGGADRPGRDVAGGGEGTRRDRTVPGRRDRQPDQLVQPRPDHPGRLGRLLLGHHMLPAIRSSARGHALSHPFAETTITVGRLGPDAVALARPRCPFGPSSTAARSRRREGPPRPKRSAPPAPATSAEAGGRAGPRSRPATAGAHSVTSSKTNQTAARC